MRPGTAIQSLGQLPVSKYLRSEAMGGMGPHFWNIPQAHFFQKQLY